MRKGRIKSKAEQKYGEMPRLNRRRKLRIPNKDFLVYGVFACQGGGKAYNPAVFNELYWLYL